MTSCSQAAADEPLAGTATTAGFLLAVEQSGPYAGRDAPSTSALPPALAGGLAEEVGRRGGRLLLIRRPGAHPVVDHPTRRVFLSLPRYPRAVTWTAELTDPLTALEWLDGPTEAASRLTEPVALVCTHGRRDVCCARRGRELLGDRPAFEVWESSHQGGHRLAPVVWELLSGYQHGRVTRPALRIIGEHAATGRVHLATARGHFGLPRAAQAVDLAVRSAGGLDQLDALRLEIDEDGTVQVTDPTGYRWAPRVTPRTTHPRVESCGADPVGARTYDVQV